MKQKRVLLVFVLIAVVLVVAGLWLAGSFDQQGTTLKDAVKVRLTGLAVLFGDDLAPGKKSVASAGFPKKNLLTVAPPYAANSFVGAATPGVKSDLAYPAGQRPGFLGGEEVTATVSVSGKNIILGANQIGNFGRVLIPANSQASISLAYPPHAAREPVIVESEDGGMLQPQGDQKTASVSQADQLDGEAKATVNFVAGTQAGIYRVTMRHGGDLKEIDFWVGPEIPVAGVAAK